MRFTTIRTVLSLQATVLLVTTALADPASEDEGVPFEGSIGGTEDFEFQEGDPSGIDLVIHGSGGGTATHLGRFTAIWDADITFANPDNPVERTFVAADGDELYAEGPGAGTPPDPDQWVVEEHVITGGTGRFEGARGSFTVERWVFNVAPPFIDLETSGSFRGTVILKGVPFEGSIGGTEDFEFQERDPSGIDLVIHGSGGGTATHLGTFTATWDADITFANPDNPVERTFVAADGDELYAEGPGAGTPPDPDQWVVEEHVISGGTGRFEGARGSFTVERWVFNVAPPFTDLETSGSFHGTIILSPTFRRGDCNDDGAVDVSDPIAHLTVQFLGQGEILCDDACDSNDDGAADVSDPIATLSVLFLGQGVILPPGTKDCGPDPTEDGLGCKQTEHCP